MKHLLLVVMFAASAACADVLTVQASGMGDTCKQALDAAKRSALDKANGSFLHSVSRDTNGRYSSHVEEYSGGVIKSFKYLRDDCTFVIIEAQVARRSNIVQFTGIDIKNDQIVHLQGLKEEQDRKQKAIQLINNRREAVFFSQEKTEMAPIEGTSDVQVSIKGTFAYKDKWKADYLDLREMFGYFNLDDFVPDPRIRVAAVDAQFETTFDGGSDWKLWKVRSYGATRTMEIIPHAKETAIIKFRVPMKQLEQIRSFKVEVL